MTSTNAGARLTEKATVQYIQPHVRQRLPPQSTTMGPAVTVRSTDGYHPESLSASPYEPAMLHAGEQRAWMILGLRLIYED